MAILFLSLLSLCYLLFLLRRLILKHRDQSCYMLAYECYKPSEDTKLDSDSCANIMKRNKNLNLEEYTFLLKTMSRAGIGENTYSPRTAIEGREGFATIEDSLKEMDDVMFETLDNLFNKTLFSPSQIDIIVVSVSTFASTPSLTSRIINRYKMRENVRAFNLSGMGCSGSVNAIGLVQQLLKTHKNSFAIVVCSECLSPGWYLGKVKSMMLSNCLFRVGGCSMLLTNKLSQRHFARLRLKHVERMHLGASDEAYGCVMQAEDEQGYKGFCLSRNLPKVGAKALEFNLKRLVPKVFPLWKLVWFFIVSLSKRGVNLKSGIQHFCVHPGGKAVIDEIGKRLGLNDYDIEPSRMTVHRWGNTTASGVWYVFSYMEAKKRLKKGDRILMIGLGSGFKCCNCVWEVMRDLEGPNVWKDCIDCYPPKPLTFIFDEALSSVKEAELKP